MKNSDDYIPRSKKDLIKEEFGFEIPVKNVLTKKLETQNSEQRIDKYSGTETTECIYTWQEVEENVESYLPNISTALKIALAVATSGSRKNRVMLWLLLVGSPSSGKTDLVRLFKKSVAVFSLDNLTLNAFISGERPTEKQQVYDLLPKLNGKCLIVKDWTVVFSLDERMTKKIIGDMVGAYDKSLAKFSSRRGNITYDSEFSHIGCITPATLNKHHNYLNMIGPRFLGYIIPDLSEEDEKKSFDAIFSNENRNEKEKLVVEIVSKYLDNLNSRDINLIKPLSKQVQEYLITASKFMAQARGIIITKAAKFTNEDGKEIAYYEQLERQIEQPWRGVQQLMILSKYLALVVGKNEVGVDECKIIKEIVISSMPADRAQAVRVLQNYEKGEITAKQLSEKVDKSAKTSRRLLDELSFLGIVEKAKGSGTIASFYNFVDKFKAFLTAHPREFMSNKVEVVKNNPNNRIGELDKEYLSTLSVSEQAKYIESKWDEL
ncbi:hypothetical protein A3J20_05365 [Candidatus Gottesmanbacteria bacterium RIFCSPLOWO2_02_FULL_42_29]|nr:MAG: hypothetical protein A3J20_05365 [Candidatus Gottesmanbacteria bacterium RIFCSPLOWO2_02_FULL_42_29]